MTASSRNICRASAISTRKSYGRLITANIRPPLGRLKVANVDYREVDALHRSISKRTPYEANRTLAVLSRMFSVAIRWKWRTDNPCKGIERNDEAKRRRYLSPEELPRLIKAFAEHRDQESADIFRLLLLTGARKGEVLSAKWDQFDLRTGTWSKPGATTKQRTEHIVPLSAPARQLLANRKRTSEFVFPGIAGGHRVEVKESWAAICKAAGIANLRMHDLRHSYASHLASAGVGLHTIGALLGHTQPSTTHRYAHLMDDPLRTATERVGAILSGNPSADIVALKGRVS